MHCMRTCRAAGAWLQVEYGVCRQRTASRDLRTCVGVSAWDASADHAAYSRSRTARIVRVQPVIMRRFRALPVFE
jgi:hypothetical protein